MPVAAVCTMLKNDSTGVGSATVVFVSICIMRDMTTNADDSARVVYRPRVDQQCRGLFGNSLTSFSLLLSNAIKGDQRVCLYIMVYFSKWVNYIIFHFLYK